MRLLIQALIYSTKGCFRWALMAEHFCCWFLFIYRERYFLNWRSGSLPDPAPRTPSQTKKRTRPRTMFSASFFQTASQNLVGFPFLRSKIKPGSCGQGVGLFTWVHCDEKCCLLFVTVTVTHRLHLTSSFSPELRGQSTSQTGTRVGPGRSCSCREELASLTGSSCNTVTPHLVSPSVSVPCFNPLLLISSRSDLHLWQRLSMCTVINATLCHTFLAAITFLNSWLIKCDCWAGRSGSPVHLSLFLNI